MIATNSIFNRSIVKKWTATKNRLNSGHSNSLILEAGHWSEYDPFLLLAEDWFERGSFDVHPHRGIETLTYVMEGKLEHYDSKTRGKDELLPGDAQWMTAGRGVIHKEDPAEGEMVHSLQLWVNLPSDQKMMEPRYQNLRMANMPVRLEEGARVIIFSGSSGGIHSETRNVIPVTMVEMQLEPGTSLKQELPGSYNGFFFVLEGEGLFGRNRIKGNQRQVLWLDSRENGQQSEVTVTAESRLRVLLYAGQPVREPVVASGPFVMNTKEQVLQAYKDYREGEFVR